MRARAACAAWPFLGSADAVFEEQAELQGYLACCHSLVATPEYLWEMLEADAPPGGADGAAPDDDDARLEQSDDARLSLPTITF